MAPRRSTRLTATPDPQNPSASQAAPKKRTPKPKRIATGNGKKAATAAKKASKKRKTGLKTAIHASAALGVVDPESNIDGSIEVLDNDPCDAMLVLIDPQKHMDKFFILQLIQTDRNVHIVYTRWGRTGTSGQGLEQSFGEDYDAAVECFQDKFNEKTGLDWTNRSQATIGKKYRFIHQNFVEKQSGYTSAKWQYWVDDGVDGKPNGWYDYDQAGSVRVEQLFQENSINSTLTNVSIVPLQQVAAHFLNSFHVEPLLITFFCFYFSVCR